MTATDHLQFIILFTPKDQISQSIVSCSKIHIACLYVYLSLGMVEGASTHLRSNIGHQPDRYSAIPTHKMKPYFGHQQNIVPSLRKEINALLLWFTFI